MKKVLEDEAPSRKWLKVVSARSPTAVSFRGALGVTIVQQNRCEYLNIIHTVPPVDTAVNVLEYGKTI
jgi:hypothetical protein